MSPPSTLSTEHELLLQRMLRVFDIQPMRSSAPGRTSRDGKLVYLDASLPPSSITGVDEAPGNMRFAQTYDVMTRNDQVNNLLVFKDQLQVELTASSCFLLIWSEPGQPQAPLDWPVLGVELVWIDPTTTNPYRAMLRLFDALIELREGQLDRGLLRFDQHSRELFEVVDSALLRCELVQRASEVDIRLALEFAPLNADDGRRIFGTAAFDRLIGEKKLAVDHRDRLSGEALSGTLFLDDQVALALGIDDPIKVKTLAANWCNLEPLSNGLWAAEQVERAVWNRRLARLAKGENYVARRNFSAYLEIPSDKLGPLMVSGALAELQLPDGNVVSPERHLRGLRELLKLNFIALGTATSANAYPISAVCDFLWTTVEQIDHLRHQGIICGQVGMRMVGLNDLLRLRRQPWLLNE